MTPTRADDDLVLAMLRQRDRGLTARAIGEPLGLRPEYVRVIFQRVDRALAKSEA
jgi:hypothetical protein